MELPKQKSSKLFLMQTSSPQLNDNNTKGNQLLVSKPNHKPHLPLCKSNSIGSFFDPLSQRCNEGIMNHPSNLSIFSSPSHLKQIPKTEISKEMARKIIKETKYPQIISKTRNKSSLGHGLDFLTSDGINTTNNNAITTKLPSPGSLNQTNNPNTNNTNTINTNMSLGANRVCSNTNDYLMIKEENKQFTQLRGVSSGKRKESPLKPFMDKDLTLLYNRYGGSNKKNDLPGSLSPYNDELLPFSRNIKLFKKMNSIQSNVDAHTPLNNKKLQESKSEKMLFPKFSSTIAQPGSTMNQKSRVLLFTERSDALLKQIAIDKGLAYSPKKVIPNKKLRAINNSQDIKNGTTKDEAETTATIQYNKKMELIGDKPCLKTLVEKCEKGRKSFKCDLITDTDTKEKGRFGKNIIPQSPEQSTLSRKNSYLFKLKINSPSKYHNQEKKTTNLSAIQSKRNNNDHSDSIREFKKTGIKSIDSHLKKLLSLIEEIDKKIDEKKDKHLFKMAEHYQKKHPKPDLPIKSPYVDNWHLMQRTIQIEALNDVVMEYPLPEVKASCSLPIPYAIYIYSTYLLFDHQALSEYIFNKKSDFIENYRIKTEEKTDSKKQQNSLTKAKTIIFPKEKEFSKPTMLYIQRFIKNDSNLVAADLLMNNNVIEEEYYETETKGHGGKRLESCKTISFLRSTSLRKRKLKSNFDSKLLNSLDVLKYKQIYGWRKDKLESSRRMSTIVDQINQSPAVLKQIVQEIYSCFKANKCNWGMDTEDLIMNNFKGDDHQVFDVLIRFIPLAESFLFKKCLTFLSNFDINLPDKRGNTLLMLAVKENSMDIAKILIEKGANVNIQNEYGNTALHYAASHKFHDLYDLLTSNRARENIMNNLGLLPNEAYNKNIEDN